jgi:hypothetical protein
VIFGARELQRRRAALVARSADERGAIAAAAAPFATKRVLAEGVVRLVRSRGAFSWLILALTLYRLVKRR